MAKLSKREYFRFKRNVRYFERSRWCDVGWHQAEVKRSHKQERQQVRLLSLAVRAQGLASNRLAS